MILHDDLLTLTHFTRINKLKCVPQIMWMLGQV